MNFFYPGFLSSKKNAGVHHTLRVCSGSFRGYLLGYGAKKICLEVFDNYLIFNLVAFTLGIHNSLIRVYIQLLSLLKIMKDRQTDNLYLSTMVIKALQLMGSCRLISCFKTQLYLLRVKNKIKLTSPTKQDLGTS